MTEVSLDCTDDQGANQALPALEDLSSRDKPWDRHKDEAVRLSKILQSIALRSSSEIENHRLKKYSERVSGCSTLLLFRRIADGETGEMLLKLRNADLCRVRVCPLCEWRRSLMYQARFLSRIEEVLKQNQGLRFVFLTLTVRNCPVEDLRSTLGGMREAWKRLALRKEFAIVKGWVRKTEVTQGKDGSAHPHYHVLLAVPPSYFSTGYIKTARWAEIWKDCLRVEYDSICDARAVRRVEDVRKEVLKYTTKASDLLGAGEEWLSVYIQQIHHLRFIDSGGILKGVFKEEEKKEDLIVTGEDASGEGDVDTGGRLVFGFKDCYRLVREFRERPPD